MRVLAFACMLGKLWLLAACSAPDYAPIRDWAATASRAAEYPALTSTCHVRPVTAGAQQAYWLAGTRAMQKAMSLYLSSLEIVAADGALSHREDPLVAEAAQALMLDETAGRAVAGLGAVLRRASLRNARAPDLREIMAEADPRLQTVTAPLSSGIVAMAAVAASDRAAVAAGYAGDFAVSKDRGTRRLMADMAAVQDRDYAVRELARTRYLSALVGIAESHALLVARRDHLSQEATAREVRRADGQLRRIADQLPQLLGPSLAGAPCAEAGVVPAPGRRGGAGS